MADFQYPDLLGQFIRGQTAANANVAQQQENTMGGLQIQQLRMALGNQQMYQDVARQSLQSQGYLGASPGAQSAQVPTGGIQNGPQGAVSQPSDGLGFTPTTLGALALLRGDDPLKTAEGVQSYQLQQKKLQLEGPMNLAKSVADDPNADMVIKNNPSLQRAWIENAPRLGLDPFTDLTPLNARRVAAFSYNNLAGQVGAQGIDLPVMEQTSNGPLGSQYQTDPRTGKTTQLKPEESLHPVIDPKTGQPVLLPASQAAGKTPFNQSIFGAANMSDQALQFAADTYRTTGKFPTSMGRNPSMQAKVLEKVAADAAATGDTAAAIAARSEARKANSMALDQVTKLEANTKSYYDTMDKNLQNLLDIQGKVDSTGSPLINKVYRAWQQGVSGDPEVARYVTYLNAVQGEYAKIKSGSLGNQAASDASRKEAAEVINKFMSQGQIQAVADAMRTEGNNRLSSIRDEKQSLLGGLSTATQNSAPGVSQTPSAKVVTQAQVQDYAKKHNLSVQAAIEHVKSHGYTVQ